MRSTFKIIGVLTVILLILSCEKESDNNNTNNNTNTNNNNNNDPCSAITCVHGVCNNISGQAVCDCDTGWEGPLCDQEEPCIDSTIIDPNRVCPLTYDPVCGCDDITYQNDCYAQKSGVLRWFGGPCP